MYRRQRTVAAVTISGMARRYSSSACRDMRHEYAFDFIGDIACRWPFDNGMRAAAAARAPFILRMLVVGRFAAAGRLISPASARSFFFIAAIDIQQAPCCFTSKSARQCATLPIGCHIAGRIFHDYAVLFGTIYFDEACSALLLYLPPASLLLASPRLPHFTPCLKFCQVYDRFLRFNYYASTLFLPDFPLMTPFSAPAPY